MRLASRCSRLESHCNGKRQRQATSFLRDFFHGAGRHGGRLGGNVAGAADAKTSTASRAETHDTEGRILQNSVVCLLTKAAINAFGGDQLVLMF